MDKVREEFEEVYRGNVFFRDDQLTNDYFSIWKTAHEFYAKETEPLKWRWDRSILYVGSYVVATIEPERDEDGINGWYAKSDAEGEELGWAVPEPEAKKACEEWAESFLAKLRGEA